MIPKIPKSALAALFSLFAWNAVTAASPEANAPISLENRERAVRVACVGDSITAGDGTPNRAFDSYPAQLQRMLGRKHWEVMNFGVGGATLLNAGDRPYQKQKAFQKALESGPDVVVIMLGTNDTKPQNWKSRDQFVADYHELIGKFKALASQPRIFICRPVPVVGNGNWGINEASMKEEIPMIDQIANDENVGLIQMREALTGREALIPDRVHPNTEGAKIMAATVYQVLTGKAFEGEVPDVARSQWSGYERLDFVLRDRSCTLVCPKTPAAGKPWIWRTEFFGAFPAVDLALLEKGYHVAYINMENLYGAPAAMTFMDAFYQHLTGTPGLSAKPVLEGFSRGGLYAFNWAALHPGQVASLYVDAPVCDFKSWPGGKGKSAGSPDDWKRCLKAYGLSEEEAMAYEKNPVDQLQPIAAAKIPVIAVCGDADRVVPIAENIQIVEKRYRELGGEIQVILKPGVDHHPHSLTDPKPVVDFILAHQASTL